MKKLGDQRTERPAGHDDGAFRAKGTSGTDGDGSGNRLEDSESRFNFGPSEQNGFNRFRDAVPANLVRAKPGHQPHDQASDYRRQDDPKAQM
jgi:hypothetical protein